MKKTENVKALKLQIDDHLKIGNNLFRISNLSTNFGEKRFQQVRINMHPVPKPKKHSYISLSVPAKTRFTIYNQ